MPRTDLTPQSTGRITPLSNPTRATPDNANGNSFNNVGQNIILYIINGNASSLVVTVDVPGTNEGEALPNKEYTILTTERLALGPFPSGYNQTNNGLTNRVLVDWSLSSSVTVEVLLIPAASSGV